MAEMSNGMGGMGCGMDLGQNVLSPPIQKAQSTGSAISPLKPLSTLTNKLTETKKQTDEEI